MAKISFNDIANIETSNDNKPTYSSNQVGFFSLKQDKEEAIVRFLIDSDNDFEIYSVHDIKLGEKFRKVGCLRSSAKEDVKKCPLCAANGKDNTLYKRSNKVYIKLLQYSAGADGGVVCEAKIWERPYSYAIDLNKNLEENGALSNYLYKVTRNGSPKDRQTNYTLTPLMNRAVYNEENYPIDKSAFDKYEVLGRIILNKNFNEMAEFVDTGNFPETQKQSNYVPAPTDEDAPPVYTRKETSAASYAPATTHSTATNTSIMEDNLPF